MKGIYTLEEWTKLSVREVLEDNIIATIHINELSDCYQSKHLLKFLIYLLEDMSLILEELNTSGLSICLSVKLVPKSINPLRFVSSLNWIEQEIIPGSVPQIMLYKPADPEFIPLIELHRIPLNKRAFGIKGSFNPFYIEERLPATKRDRIKLNRELLFIYGNVSQKTASQQSTSFTLLRSRSTLLL